MRRVWPEADCKKLRVFHMKRDAYDVFMLWNEDIFSEIDTKIVFPSVDDLAACGERRAVFYDAWNNKAYAAVHDGNKVRVRLAPSEAIVVAFGLWEEELPAYDYRDGSLAELSLSWKVSLCSAGEKEWKAYPLNGLKNLARELPDFGGVIRYEADWNTDTPENYGVLELTNVGETAQLWINDAYCGAVVEKPYRFAISGQLHAGENRIRIEVMSNLAYRERDKFSTYVPLPTTGLTGPVKVG